jgi:hypothetical protein
MIRAADGRNEIVAPHCKPYHAVPIEKVSAQSLPKTGVFRDRAGDFREILVQVAAFRRLETDTNRTKSPQNAGFWRKG